MNEKSTNVALLATIGGHLFILTEYTALQLKMNIKNKKDYLIYYYYL